MIIYNIGDATYPVGEGKKLLIHIVNTKGGFGAGFVLALSKRWSQPEKAYRAWHRNRINYEAGDKDFTLGNVQYVKVSDEIAVVNMIAQEGYSKPGKPAIRYKALESCLRKVAYISNLRNFSVHCPRIGAGLAGGSWSIIEGLISDIFIDEQEVNIYDLPK